MKKISILASFLMLLGLGITSCVEDTQPRLEAPTEFVLNTPPAASELYMFRADDKNKSLYDITFTCSQPNYGLGTVPNYQVQVAKSEADFAAWDKSEGRDGSFETDNAILGSDGLPLVNTIEYNYNNASITVTGDLFSAAVNAIYGFQEDNYDGRAVPVYVRLHCYVPGADYSSIYSNVVCLEKVSSYIPISAPGVLYLIGAPSGWDINSEAMVATETEIGSKIYYGVFNIAEGQFQFRFYTQLGDWESWSVGSQDADDSIEIAFDATGKYTGPVYVSEGNADKKGKGSWKVSGWEGGKVAVTVNLNTKEIVIEKFEGAKIYVIGACSGWDINNDKVYITEKVEGSGVYTGTISVEAGQFQFRFYTALGDWENNSIGAQVEDNSVAISMASGSYTGPCVNGKGSWQDASWAGGDVKVTLDTNNMEVTFETV